MPLIGGGIFYFPINEITADTPNVVYTYRPKSAHHQNPLGDFEIQQALVLCAKTPQNRKIAFGTFSHFSESLLVATPPNPYFTFKGDLIHG